MRDHWGHHACVRGSARSRRSREPTRGTQRGRQRQSPAQTRRSGPTGSSPCHASPGEGIATRER
eukprot:7703539-Alexandrium_andersonii.AAC.1